MTDMKYLRRRKAALLKERYALYAESPCASIEEIEDCTFDINPENGLPEPIKRGKEKNIYSITYDARSIVWLGEFKEHWGHFITENLSTFWFLARDLKADAYVFSFRAGKTPKISSNAKEALRLLGVWDKVEILNEPRRYKSVYIPMKGMEPRGYCLPESAEVYDRIIGSALKGFSDQGTREKIILSRSQFPKAKKNEIGLDQIEGIFIDNGFRPCNPERISLTELIRTMAQATEIATICGTPAHNLLFAPQGIQTVILEKYPNINNFQQGIDLLKKLDVTYIDASYMVGNVDPGLGPFIFGYTDGLRSWMKDHGIEEKRSFPGVAQTLRRFFRLSRRYYMYQWVFPEWLEPEIDLLREAYEDSLVLFGPWLDGRKRWNISDLLSPYRMAKRIIGFFGYRQG